MARENEKRFDLARGYRAKMRGRVSGLSKLEFSPVMAR